MKILAYLLSCVILVSINFIFVPFSWFLAYLLKTFKSLLILASLLLNILIRVAAVFAIAQVCELLSVKPALLMIILPGVFIILEDLRRITLAEKGISRVKKTLELHGDVNSYNQAKDIIMEWAFLIGDLVGISLGAVWFMRGSDFL